MSERVFPRTLTTVVGPFSPAKITGAADGMGSYGQATRSLAAQGLLAPDLICGMTLALLAQQPRRPRPDPGAASGNARRRSGVAGRVWVRERFTIHRPIAADDPWTVDGEVVGAHVRKGRSYSTTVSRSVDSTGRPFATNVTTGLVSYRPDPTKPDSFEGLSADDVPTPGPDAQAAGSNPHLEAIKALSTGQTLGEVEVPMTLAMMAARDTENPDNPIHSDPAEAQKAGLARPIAGGSHVLAFALEAIMGHTGPQALLHGASFDIGWKAPTQDDTVILPRATVTSADAHRVVLAVAVDLVGGPTAMTGTVTIPLA